MKPPSDESQVRRELGLSDDGGATRPIDAGAARAARRAHMTLVRTYEAFDRDHDIYRERLLDAVRDEARLAAHPSPHGPQPGGWIMRHILTRKAALILTPAACLALAAAFFFLPGQKPVLARALDRFRQAPVIVCQTRAVVRSQQGEQTTEGRLAMSAEFGSRFEPLESGRSSPTMYFRPDGSVVAVRADEKTYTVITSHDDDDLSALGKRSPDEWLRSLRRATIDGRCVGTREINGVACEGYELDGAKAHYPHWRRPAAGENAPDPRMVLWIDPRAELPVSLEATVPGPQPDSTLTMVHDQFEWSTALARADFEPPIDDSYERVELNMPRAGEAALINGLRACAEMFGEYPAALDPATLAARVSAMMVRKAADKSEQGDWHAAMHSASGPALQLAAGAKFLVQLDADGRKPEYFGDEVRPGDADKVLVRYLLPSGEARMIYGDLRAETLDRP